MKRIVLSIALLLGMCLLVASCDKQGTSSFVGTWSFVEEGEKDEGDYVVIEQNLISFHYAEGGFDDGVKYKFEYDHPHIFIAGLNAYDVVSKSRNRMVWKETIGEEGSYSAYGVTVSKENPRYVLTRK